MFKRGFLTGAVVLAVAGSTAAVASAKSFYVTAKGGNNANPCSKAAPCSTIEHTIGKAKKGDTVFVLKGTYRQDVVVRKDVRIVGVGNPVDDLKGRNDNGFSFLGPKSAGASVSGFVVKGATFEGIVAKQTSHITIANNVVEGNDRGARAQHPTGECAPQGEIPGDCGEAIHLYGGVDHSLITRNTVTGNTGGILLSDEFGPTAHNTISRNNVFANKSDCGITIVGHNPGATKNGARQPQVAGVFGNAITGNTVNANGTKGEGGGILMAAAAPGGAVYDNTIKGNSATGNGLAGVTIHNHDFGKAPNGQPLPPADLNGNKILNNKLTHNGVADKSEAEFGGADFAKGNTVGILIGSGAAKLTGIVITGNTINNSHFGVYTKNDTTKVNKAKNAFHKVKVKVKQA